MQDHWGDTLQPALLQHLKLAVIAVVIGFVIAFASALVAKRYRKLDQPIGLFTDFLYTIPSLALFQLLVPLTGLTVTTVEVALVAYTLLILYRNILEGFRAVPEEVLESARGMGLTQLQTLVRVELPLATPSIVAGLRIATVSTISIATIAAFVIPQGLGYPIYIGIQQDDLQDGDHRRRRPGDPARARRRRADHPRRPRADAVEAARDRSSPTRFNWGTFPDAIRFIGDHPHLLWDKTVQHLALSGAALGIAIAIALPLGVVLGHYHRGSFLAISVSNVGRALPSLVLIAFFLLVSNDFFWDNTCGARHPRHPADPDQRLLRGRPGRPERRRVGAGDGDDRAADPDRASSCRSPRR